MQLESRNLTAVNKRARDKIIGALYIIVYLSWKPIFYDILALVSLGE
jgi:hypothetical protein